MTDKPPHSKTSETPSSLSLDSLNRLQQKATMMKEILATATTEKPLRERRGTDGALVRSRTNKHALDQFEDSVGGRGGLINTISLAELDRKQEHFLRLLCDPARAGDNLATICRDAGLLPSQILSLFRDASFAKAHAIALGQLTEEVPAIVADLTAKSLDEIIICPKCLGDGAGNTEDGLCEMCYGRKEIMRPGDLDHKKVALEIGGLLKKGGGVNVQVQQNNLTTAAPGAFFSKFVKSTDTDAYSVTAEAIEGEKVGE